jgi:hypothetical protein
MLILSGLSKVQAATYSMFPSSAEYIKNCNSTVILEIDATGESSNAADVEIHFDPTEIEVIDQDASSSGIQVRVGNAYQSYVYNQVNNSAGIIKIAALSLGNNLNSKKNFAFIEFRSKNDSLNANFDILFSGVGNTIDSNIADAVTSDDLLTGVTNGSYTFVDGSCSSDTQAPVVNHIYPQDLDTNVALDSNVEFQITDDISGVDLNSLEFILDGQSYSYDAAFVSYSGDPLDFYFTINPVQNFPADQPISLVVKGQDNAGNIFLSTIVFNNPEPVIPPEPTPTPVPTPVASPSPGVVPPTVPTRCDEPVSYPDCQYTSGATCNDIFSSEPLEIFKDTILENTIIDDIVKSVGIPGLVAISSAGVLLTSLFSILGVLNAPSMILNALYMVVFGKRSKTWGLVIDAQTEKVLPFSACRVFVSGSSSIVTQTVSDSKGRYGFTLSPGKYRLEVSKSGYQKSESEIDVDQDNSVVHDVYLVPNKLLNKTKSEKSKMSLREIFGGIYRKLLPIIFFVGISVAILNLMINSNVWNLIVVSFYVLGSMLYVLYKYRQRSIGHSAVVDSKTNLRVPHAIVKIFDLKTWKLVTSLSTGYNGYFDVFVEPGEYGILVVKKGYNYPSSESDKARVAGKYESVIKAYFENGGNEIVFYMDPQESKYKLKSEQSQALGSPFS